MTVEGKAKAYVEALEGIQEILEEIQNILHSGQDTELQESENEKIRKELINTINLSYDCGIAITKENRDKYIAWLEKQGEDKPADKVEPKFHEGDWITDGYVGGQITSIEDNYPCYKIADFMGGINTSIPFSLQDNYHLWTIADAKDGDVLVSEYNKPFIYNGKHISDSVGAYCGINIYDEFTISITVYEWTDYNNIKPATKEQCEQLFKVMHEEGWEWNANKKKLKKIEEKPKWSEKDKKMVETLIGIFEVNYPSGFYKVNSIEILKWLKSLKQRQK